MSIVLDGTTGITTPAETVSGTGVWSVGGTQIYKDSSGNVGIGTGTPATPLDVVANSGSLALSIRGRSSDNIGTLMFYTNNGVTNTAQIQSRSNEFRFLGTGATALTFYSNGSEQMRLDSSGNLGLGVTPSAWHSAIRAFQITAGTGYTATTALASGFDASYLFNNTYFDNVGAGTFKYVGSTYATQYQQYQGKHIWYNAPSGTAGTAISFTQAMTLDASGNLLLNTTSQINSARYSFSTPSSGFGMVVRCIVGTNNPGLFVSTVESSNTTQVWSSSSNGADKLSLGTGGVERAVFDNNGNFITSVTGTAPTLSTNSQMTFELTNNTTLKIKVRGTDGTTRSVSLTLA